MIWRTFRRSTCDLEKCNHEPSLVTAPSAWRGRPLSRAGFIPFAETLRAWAGQLEGGTDESCHMAPNSCGEPHRRPISNDTANRAPVADRGAL
jgi:hypothetical protein